MRYTPAEITCFPFNGAGTLLGFAPAGYVLVRTTLCWAPPPPCRTTIAIPRFVQPISQPQYQILRQIIPTAPRDKPQTRHSPNSCRDPGPVRQAGSHPRLHRTGECPVDKPSPD